MLRILFDVTPTLRPAVCLQGGANTHTAMWQRTSTASSRLCPTGACAAARPTRLMRTLPPPPSTPSADSPAVALKAARPMLPYALRSCCSSFLIFSSLTAPHTHTCAHILIISLVTFSATASEDIMGQCCCCAHASSRLRSLLLLRIHAARACTSTAACALLLTCGPGPCAALPAAVLPPPLLLPEHPAPPQELPWPPD